MRSEIFHMLKNSRDRLDKHSRLRRVVLGLLAFIESWQRHWVVVMTQYGKSEVSATLLCQDHNKKRDYGEVLLYSILGPLNMKGSHKQTTKFALWSLLRRLPKRQEENWC